MARPRVFVSSTFYDLRQVRADLERFVSQLGYDPILHERGRVPYGSKKELEEYCYREIDLCDIVVSIIGGRYGTGSQQQPYSISQTELKRAVDRGKAVFIFVERSVYAEYQTYLKNKKTKGVVYNFVDNTAIYEFIEEVEALPRNNPIAPFETAQDIAAFLQEQWAGLFQRFLQEQSRAKEMEIVESMANTAKTLDQLVKFLTEERRNKDQAIQEILLTNHPAFQRLRNVTSVPYRVFFTNRSELNEWLKARGFNPVPKDAWDDTKYQEWMDDRDKAEEMIVKIAVSIFDDNGKLKVYTSEEWKDKWILLEKIPKPPAPAGSSPITDEDIPF
jgi:hypothetical protein